MCRSINLWGHQVDLGPHRFFSKNLKVNNLWLEMAGEDHVNVQRLTRVFYKGSFFYIRSRFLMCLQNLDQLKLFVASLATFQGHAFSRKTTTAKIQILKNG